MNLLRWNLCDVEGAEFYPIWINTWQYSLLKSPGQTIVNILEGIINQIGNLNPNPNKWEESKKKIGGIFRKMATLGTKVVANQVGIDGSLVDDIFAESGDVPESDIAALKAEITKLIADSLAHNPQKKGFTFYIDDLDRIDPPMAVEILELLKNIFDIENCMCMDILAGCAGFINAFDIAKLYIDSGRINTALVVGVEKLSEHIDRNDINTEILLADGAGAIVIKKCESKKLYDSYIESKGQKGEILTYRNNEKIYMDGKEVYKYAVTDTVKNINKVLLNRM